jgi:tRNA-splicing ligase RtcB
MITGKTLQEWGYTPGPWFRDALAEAGRLTSLGVEPDTIRERLARFAPAAPVYQTRRDRDTLPFTINLETDTPDEHANSAAVAEHMAELMRVPTIKAGAVMPDACPAGSAKGTIPVGGVVACENAIHPGFHSADVCCSMAITVMPRTDPKTVLDLGMRLTHFGPGGRPHHADVAMSADLIERILANPITAPLIHHAHQHLATQGDGNHFFYTGRLKSSGETALVTHHGSRGFGARVYKAGMRIAEAMTRKIAPSVPKHQTWIVADSQEGQDYWEALQICREWTKQNHFAIHNMVTAATGSPSGRFWNEHNFVFQKSDGLFYHAKGATPAFPNFSADEIGLTLIPMNMAEPILIARGLNAERGLGFAPHGAGRNLSRTGYLKRLGEERPVAGVDARWFSGKEDMSELPGAYKDAASVRRQIATFGLAEIVDEVLPYGCIMAGEIDWRAAGKELGDAA